MLDLGNPVWWFGQGLAALGYSAVFASAWSRQRRSTVLGKAVASALFAGQYALLGLWGNVGIAVLHTVRALMLSADGIARRTRVTVAALFLAATTTAYLLLSGWPDQWYEWFPLASTMLTTTALSLTDVRRIKELSFCAGIAFLVFTAAAGLPVMVVGEVVGLVANAVAWSRLRAAQTAERQRPATCTLAPS